MQGESDAPIRMTRITLRGTRGFKDSETLDLASPTGRIGSGLTIVVGANNAGKSTVWEAFEVLARKSGGSEVDFSEGRRNRATQGGVNLKLERSDGTDYVVESWPLGSSRTKATGTPLGPTDLVVVPSRRQFQPNFGRHGGTQINWMSSGQEYSRTQIRDPFTGRLFDLHDGDEVRRREFDALLAYVVGEPIRWAIELGDGGQGNSHYLKITVDESTEHNSEGLGEGIISLLFVLDSIFSAAPGTAVVIDEPELSLHPQLVHRLSKVLAEFAATHQIVIFTHSPHLVNWDSFESGARVARVYKEGAVSRIAQPSPESISQLDRIRRKDLNNPHILGNDANETLFLDDKVLLVEGQEDVVLLPRVFKSLNLPDPENYFGWGASGAPNMEKILVFLEELGFRYVAVVLDNNVPDIAERLRQRFPNYLVVEHPAEDIRTKNSKIGLLDDDNRGVRGDFEVEARVVFEKVVDFLGVRDQASEPRSLTTPEVSSRTPSMDDQVV